MAYDADSLTQLQREARLRQQHAAAGRAYPRTNKSEDRNARRLLVCRPVRQ